MGPEQTRAFGEQLSACLHYLRNLEPPAEDFIGSVNRGSLLDHRACHIHFGLFHCVGDFQSYLRLGGPLYAWLYDSVVKTVHGRSDECRVKFTHADLSPRNIQYHNGRITGIIDWETAGWYPEYWEYTKMWFVDRPAHQEFFKAIEGNSTIEMYPEELKAERDI